MKKKDAKRWKKAARRLYKLHSRLLESYTELFRATEDFCTNCCEHPDECPSGCPLRVARTNPFGIKKEEGE